MAEKQGIKIITQNKKAWHDYFVDEKYEAGIELYGTEVKSIRGGASISRTPTVTSRTASCTPSASTSAPTSMAIFSTASPCATASS